MMGTTPNGRHIPAHWLVEWPDLCVYERSGFTRITKVVLTA